MNARRQLLGLEVLRFACTIGVLLWHYQHFYSTGTFVAASQPFFAELRPIYLYGRYGVWVFWCLSGFIFWWKYADTIRTRKISLGKFARLRISRLYPLHVVTLGAVAVLVWVWHADTAGHVFGFHFDNWRFVQQLFMASNWASSDVSFNGPAWSVSVEVIVYLAFFALCRFGVTRWWAMLPIVVGAEQLYERHIVTIPVALCVFMFYLGALTACLHRRIERRGRAAVAMLAVVGLAVATRLVAVDVISPAHFVQAMAPVVVMLAALAVQPRSARAGRVIEELGNLTYSSYLWHFPLQLVVLLCFAANPTAVPHNSPWFLFGYLGGTYAVAALSYRVLERPAQNWLRRSRSRQDVVGTIPNPYHVSITPEMVVASVSDVPPDAICSGRFTAVPALWIPPTSIGSDPASVMAV